MSLRQILFLTIVAASIPLSAAVPPAVKERALITWVFSDTSGATPTSRNHLFTENQKLYHLLIRGLSEYRHDFFYASVPRIEHELKKGPRICYPSSSSAELRKKFTYLTPLYISPSVVLVLKKSLFEKYKSADGKVAIKKLLTNKNLRPIFSEARSYGPRLDKLIAENRPNEPRHVTQTFALNTVDIIAHDRADYTIEYEFIIRDYLKTTANKMVTIAPIEEIPPFNTQYLACSRTPEGLEVIRKADEVIRASAKDPEFKDAMLSFNTNSKNKEFLNAVNEFVKTRDSKKLIIE